MTDELTTQVLIDIRTELREMRVENREMREDIRGTNARLDRVVQEQIRHGTALVALEARVGHMEDRLGNAVEGLNERLDNVLLGPMGRTVR